MSIDDSGRDKAKLRWNLQENRITSKAGGVRAGPSKDHSAAINYLEDQRSRHYRLGSQNERLGNEAAGYGSVNHDMVSLDSVVSHPGSINLKPDVNRRNRDNPLDLSKVFQPARLNGSRIYSGVKIKNG